MKKILLLLFFIIVIPSWVFAVEYDNIGGLSINLDSSKWISFQKGNDNSSSISKLSVYGVNESNIDRIFEYGVDFYSIKINSFEKKDYIELFVLKKVSKYNKDLNEYSDEEIESFANNLIEQNGASSYSIYIVDNYKYIKSNYYDSTLGVNVIDYYTLNDGYAYTIKFQKHVSFYNSEYQDIQDIVKYIEFNEKNVIKDKRMYLFMLGIFIVILVIVIFFCLDLDKRNNKKTNNQEVLKLNEKNINKRKTSKNINQKYDDLIKLKELYDKKIITKEEFDSEKKNTLE